jgi:hypothetical protein
MSRSASSRVPARAGSTIACVGLLILAGCSRQETPAAVHASEDPVGLTSIEEQVTQFCGDCHAVPPVDSFPKRAWRDEVGLGFTLYYESYRNDLVVPSFDRVVDYYVSRAPEELVLPEPEEATDPGPIRFENSELAYPDSAPVFFGVANMRWLPPGTDGRPRLLICDGKTGQVGDVAFRGRDATVKLLGTLASPVHITPSDLDGDGVLDFVIADLGTFQPADHDRGRVLWLLDGTASQPRFELIQDQLGRVADVEPGDFDEDGDLDLVVAEFGWRSTGQLLMLEQVPSTGSGRDFRRRTLDDRHGTIHVPVTDLNRDGHLDFVALFAQEFEMIVAFLGRGDGTFEQHLVFAAGDPSVGSSGIELVDLDGDGDLDVLYTCGDTLDGYYLKPDHGIRWLENCGGFPFVPHLLTPMPGAMRALAADLDGDDDLDIVACAFLPTWLLKSGSVTEYDSVIWLEQVAPRTFARRRLEQSEFGHMAMEVGDFDGDGRTDLVVGNFASGQQSTCPWLRFFWNVPK